jgi:hypothetical protein
MVGAVRGIDAAGHYFDETRRYIDAPPGHRRNSASSEERPGVFPRLTALLQQRGL